MKKTVFKPIDPKRHSMNYTALEHGTIDAMHFSTAGALV